MRAKRYNRPFKCAHCPVETDKGYEIDPGVIVCDECYKKVREKK